jgi:hypothetical protein
MRLHIPFSRHCCSLVANKMALTTSNTPATIKPVLVRNSDDPSGTPAQSNMTFSAANILFCLLFESILFSALPQF